MKLREPFTFMTQPYFYAFKKINQKFSLLFILETVILISKDSLPSDYYLLKILTSIEFEATVFLLNINIFCYKFKISSENY